MAKKNYRVYTTPRVGLKFASIFEPKLKYKKEDEYEYTVNLVMDKDTAKIVIGEIEGYLNEVESELLASLPKKDKKGKKVKPERHVYYWNELDKNEKETGNIEMQVKCDAIYKDKKTGRMIDLAPLVVDSKRVKMQPVQVWNGSEGKVFMLLKPFSMPSGLYGISTKLKGIQILELVSNQMSAEQMGFDEEEGYNAQDSTFEPSSPDGFATDVEEDSEDYDF